MFSLNQWLIDNPPPSGYVRYPMFLKDGQSLSIQASTEHYCDGKEGSWTTVEISTSWNMIPYLHRHNDDGVWGHVPVRLLEMLIMHHGGPVERKE